MDIVYDFASIAANMKDDGWYAPAKPEEKVDFEYGTAPAVMVVKPRSKSFREIIQEASAKQGRAPTATMVREAADAFKRGNLIPRPSWNDDLEIMPYPPSPGAERMIHLQREMDEVRRKMIEYMHYAISPPRIMLPLRDEDKGAW